MTKYNVATDAVTTTVEANSINEAAAKFAAGEPVYRGKNIKTASDLSAAAEEMGGWAKISEE